MLVVTDLSVVVPDAGEPRVVLSRVSFTVSRGGARAVIGATGAGKTLLVGALLGFLDARAQVRGSVKLDDHELLGIDAAARRRVSGGIALLPPHAERALPPFRPIGMELARAIAARDGTPARRARDAAVEALEEVGVRDAPAAARLRPDELTAAVRQRALVALALAGGARVLVADEPLAGLDVTVGAELFEVLATVPKARGCALLLLTGDPDVASALCEEVAVLDQGVLVEQGRFRDLAAAPQHGATRRLLDGARRLRRGRGARG